MVIACNSSRELPGVAAAYLELLVVTYKGVNKRTYLAKKLLSKLIASIVG